MSRLTDLIASVRGIDPKLGADLDREFKVISSRLPFGLNFERHRPEAVELPLRQIRKGDKVRVLPPRGSSEKGDPRLWRVKAIHKHQRIGELELIGYAELEECSVPLEDVVVVAEFRDTIFPGLLSTGKVEHGNDRPYHTVINGENYHVLKALTFTHRAQIDAIYIDPPYNSGAKDWKYNNNYVEADDLYRHSKWLAMMERRLLIAKELLKPSNSVLILAIDEKEYLRLGLLLEQLFPEAKIEMVTTVVNPRGRHRPGRFSRSEEYIYFVMFGDAVVGKEVDSDFEGGSNVPWRTLRRSDASSARGTAKGGPAQFYPIYVSKDGKIVEIGDPLSHGILRTSVPVKPGCTAVFPVRDTGLEMNWGLTSPVLKKLLKKGYVRVGRQNLKKPQQWEISYLTSGKISDIDSGRAVIVGRNTDGSVKAEYVEDKLKTPTSTWVRPSHNAETGGTLLLGQIIPNRKFPFPKSLYAVEDALRLFTADKRNALVLDFFSGSGTTAHAVMRLNHQDGGIRQCISVTNNEVSADEQKSLRQKGLRPGDEEWEKLGICDYITKPRIKAAITGRTPDGEPIEGDYKFADKFPMAEGFKGNAEFLTLTYEAKDAVNHSLAFSHIAPLLWLRAGARGKRIDILPDDGWAVADSYGLLTEVDKATPFIHALQDIQDLHTAYIVTDDDRRFQAIARRLPKGVQPVRLYESYLTNFSFANGD